MKKKILIIYLSLTFLYLISSFVASANENDDLSTPGIFSFQSSFDIDYEMNQLNETLEINKAITIPLSITYSTDIPSNFLRFFPKGIKNYLLYKSTNVPQQTHTYEIIDSPNWINCFLDKNQSTTTIPSAASPIILNNTLIVTPTSIASPEQYTITIKTSCETIGKITGYTKKIDIFFYPSFHPKGSISIKGENSIILSYKNDTKTSFQIVSKANTLTRVTPYIQNDYENITISFYPKFQDAYYEETATFYMEMIPKKGCKKNTSINVSATLQSFPLSKSDPVELNKNITYYLKEPIEDNNGFLPDPFLILSLFLGVIIIIMIFFGKKKNCW